MLENNTVERTARRARNPEKRGFPAGRSVMAGLALAMLSALPALSATFTVSQDGRGAFTSIKEAVKRAGKGDVVEVLDAGIYKEEVVIDSTKNGLTLRSSNPLASKKPVIMMQDIAHQNPKTCADALKPNTIDFDQNGALRILNAHNITIDGIAVDGVSPAPFAWPNIWGNGENCSGLLFPLFHGSSGIVLYLSGNVTIRNCDISNAFFGISVKDRNQGGVFANFNPADLEKFNIVPLSGFGRTGNHMFEKNRIHNNVWGFYFESAWDLGSTVRYNLIYENHHATPVSANAVKNMLDGQHQPGGGFLFKDVMLTPLAIYNNTFWHNFANFAGGYRPGAQHLVFNNIFAKPNEYLAQSTAFPNPFHILDPFFANRMKHCIFAAQTEPPKLDSQKVQAQQYDNGTMQQVLKDSVVKFYRSVRIMNNMGNVAQENFIVNLTLPMSTGPVVVPQTINGANLPGGLIGSATDPFPPAANVRWYEIKFKSTDPASPDFLSPDWDDPDVKKFVMNAGWPEAGIHNSDGKVADLGAVPSVGRHSADVVIRPLAPAIINGTTATLSFDLQPIVGDLQAPKVKYIRLVRSIPVLVDGFGGTKLLAVTEPVTVTVSNSSLKMGSNTLTVTGFTALAATESFAFFEIIAEGLAPNGMTATTNVGFIPYRKLDYKFVVEIIDAANNKLPSVKVGETVRLRITPQKLDGTPFSNPISPVEVNLNSGADLVAPGTPPVKLALPKVESITTAPVMFTKVPPSGTEYVTVSGIWKSGTNTLAFYGVSDGIKILPGDPEKVIFQDPPSKILTPGAAPVIDPGTLYSVKVEVRDRFDNKIGTPISVTIKSNQPAIGDIDGLPIANTDSTGTAVFKVKVTNGDLNQIFELEAAIANKTPDKADLKVGKARDKLWILYADIAGYKPETELRGTAGERVQVTIRAGKDADTKLADRQTEFKVDATPGLAVYANATDAAPSATFKLTNGEAVIWVTGLMPVDNGSLTVSPSTDNTILPGNRGKIFFAFVPSSVLSASFHADNGYAQVDRIEIRLRDALKRAPDSISVSWPATGLNSRTVTAGIAVDPADPKHLTLKLAVPFPPGLSTGAGSGKLYTFDPATPDIPVQAAAFTGADSVGTLLDSAKVQEKSGPGGDTLFMAFNEKIVAAGLNGASLILIRQAGGAPVTLAVLSSSELAAGKGFRVAIADLGALAPVAGDSLKINPAGPLTDALGNHAHADNRPVVLILKTVPKPPILTLRMDRPFLGVEAGAQGPDFLLLSPNADSSWTPVQGSLPNGTVADCKSLPCGNPIRGDGAGSIDRTAFTVETDRAIKYSVTIFTNLGEFVNGFSGEITNGQLGLDERNLPVTGASPLFRRNAQGRYAVKISWNAKAHGNARAATGAYIAKVSASSRAENADGKPYSMVESKAIRFGLMRK
jgi:parallel beta-helix repeat protein